MSNDELERARTGLLSSLVMQGESSGARASALARDTYLLGRPRQIEAIKQSLTQIDLNQLNAFLEQRTEPKYSILTLGPTPLETYHGGPSS